MTDTLSEKATVDTNEIADNNTLAIALGIAAGMAAATIAVAVYIKAKQPDRHIRDIDKVIAGVQQKMRTLQEMIDAQQKPLSTA